MVEDEELDDLLLATVVPDEVDEAEEVDEAGDVDEAGEVDEVEEVDKAGEVDEAEEADETGTVFVDVATTVEVLVV